MFGLTMSRIRPRTIPPSPDPTEGTVGDADEHWLDCVGNLADEHAIVLGPDLGVMCALIRRGCLEVTELQRLERPEPHNAGLAVIPEVSTTDGAASAIAHAHRGLNRAGRIVLRTARDPSGRVAAAARRILALHGFSAIRQYREDGRSILYGEVPMFGPLRPATVSRRRVA